MKAILFFLVLTVAAVLLFKESGAVNVTAEERVLLDDVSKRLAGKKKVFQKMKLGDNVPLTTDEFLAKIVRKKKNHVGDTVENIEKLYQVVRDNADMFQGTLSKACADNYKNDEIKLLAKRWDGSPVLVLKINKEWTKQDIRKVSLATAFISQQTAKEEEEAQIVGHTLIIDAGGSAKGFLDLKSVVSDCSTAMFATKPKAIRIINAPSEAITLYKGVKLFLKKHVKQVVDITDPKKLQLDDPLVEMSADGKTMVVKNDIWDNAMFTKLTTEDMCFDAYWKP